MKISKIGFVTLLSLSMIALFFKGQQSRFFSNFGNSAMLPKISWNFKEQPTFYNISYRNTGEIDVAGSLMVSSSDKKSTQKMNVEVTGGLILQAPDDSIAAPKTILRRIGQFTSAKVVMAVENQNNSSLSKLAELELNHRFIAKNSLAGVFSGVEVQSDLSQTSGNIIREFFTIFQLCLPSAPIQTLSWECKETDGNGVHEVLYSMDDIDSNGIITIKKTLGQYTAKEGSELEIASKGEYTVIFDSINGRINSFAGKTFQELSQSGKKVASWSTDITALLSKNPDPQSKLMPFLAGSPSSSLRKIDAELPQTDPETERKMQKNVLGDSTLEQLEGLLSERDNDGKKFVIKKNTSELVNKLYAWLFLHPESTSDFVDILKRTGGDSDSFVFALGALYQVGHPQAQKGLAEALANSHGDVLKVNSILAVTGLVKNPSPELEDSVRNAAAVATTNSTTKSTALLALGNMVSNMSAEAEPRREQIIRELKQSLAGARSEQDTSASVIALGNTMSASSVESLTSVISNPSTILRGDAYLGLGKIGTRGARDLILNGIATDADEHVRYVASDGLINCSLDANDVTKLAAIFSQEKSPMIRSSIIRIVWKNRLKHPTVTASLMKLGAEDPSPEVQKTARSFLIEADETK